MDRPRITAHKKVYPGYLGSDSDLDWHDQVLQTIEELKAELTADGVQYFIDPQVSTWKLPTDPYALVIELSVDPYSRPEDW